MQPGRNVGAVLARRRGRHPQALSHAAAGGGGAKGQLARGQFVQHHADGEDVAARVAAHAHHLFGRYPRGRAHGLAHLLGQQVGVVGVAREAKVQQHGRAIVLDEHVGRFEVQVAHVLLVQAVRSVGRGRAQAGDGCRVAAARPFVEPVLQRLAGDVFHDQVRQPHQVARRHKTRHMRAAEHGQDLQLDLEAHDVLGPVARRHARDLHRHGKAGAAVGLRVFHRVDVGHATRVDAVHHAEAVDLGAGLQQFHVTGLFRAGRRRSRAGPPREWRRRRPGGRRARGRT